MKKSASNRGFRHDLGMAIATSCVTSRRQNQFRLLALLAYMTWCAVLAACASAVGLPASILLMLVALALWARRGLVALIMLMAASLAADVAHDPDPTAASLGRQGLVLLLAWALCLWYGARRCARNPLVKFR